MNPLVILFQASVLRWCRPARVGDVFVPFGARRRRPFLQEGPNRFVLRVEEGIPDLDLLWSLLKNPEEGFLGSFLGLPKESFTATFDPSGDF
ncbi:hypothetical protein Taro_049323, partial [Colocasia esculenta]|nr:hypothetical protein [Colocasia esculenta]